MKRAGIVILIFFFLNLGWAQSSGGNSSDLPAKIDAVVREVLASTGAPSASVAVVQNGRVTYVHAYGDAKLDPRQTATPEMRYSIGSISKQFTTAAVLMLVQQGKLSLDYRIARFVPTLTHAKDITIRQLLSHTSGYQDFWPQDYVPPFMLQPTTAEKILDGWARKPLDFEPGTQWQYSNTGFVIAGLIVEKASGMPLLQFLQKNIFAPLGMTSVMNVDQNHLTESDPTGYMRYALGPPRPALKEGKGWLFAAGELAMTAEDLAKWDISLMNESLLKPESYRQMETEVVLKNGMGTQYGLGVDVRKEYGHRSIEHGGEVSGFSAQNIVLPDDHAAIVVLTNQDSTTAPGDIAREIVPLLFRNAETAQQEQKAREIFTGLQQGKIDRALLTGNCNSYFTAQALHDFAASLGPLGPPQDFQQASSADRGGMTFRRFQVRYPDKLLEIWERVMPDGKIEQYEVLQR